jgi:flagellar L-ring protein FlgH
MMSFLLLALGVRLAHAQEPAAEAPPEERRPILLSTPTPAHPYPSGEPSAPGSLWIESQARMMVGLDGNARSVGDLVTILILEESSASIGADTTAGSSSQNSAQIESLLGLSTGITAANPNMGGTIGFGTGSDYAYSGSGLTSREGVVEGIITATVIEVYPNGNLRISGTKEVRSNNETQYLTIEGTVRPQDIQADNMVKSSLLADSVVEITGRGSVNDDQKVRTGTRLLKTVWPF